MMQTNRRQQVVERFEYPVAPFAAPVPTVFELAEDATRDESIGCECTESRGCTVSGAEVEKLLEDERQRAFTAGRELGLREGRRLEHEAHEAAAKTKEDWHIRQIAQLMDRFAQERDHYLREVEREVVKLALAVAARILRREAQLDPLLLTGAVRVALGQLSESTEIRLRVPSTELDLWKETIDLLPNLAVKPKVVAGEGMRMGDCAIESKLGSVDLGIRSQLVEIERGFFKNAAKAEAAPERHAAQSTAGGDS